MKRKTWILYLALAAAVAALAFYARGRIHFNWGTFVEQLRMADWGMIGVGVALISLAYVVRAMRWVLFLKPAARIPMFSRSWFDVLGAQIIGYTGVALLGRPADLMRPYLVARRVRLTLSSQVAVWVVERMFDLCATALIFSAVLLFAHDRANLPYHEKLIHFAKLGLASIAGFIAFAVAMRLKSESIAATAERVFAKFSAELGASVAAKINAFRDGLDTLKSVRDVISALVLSLFMWGLIMLAYWVSLRAFVDSPPLHHFSLTSCVIIMAVGMASSTIQLPVVGWFTQIGIIAAALRFLGAATEPALGASTVLLIVTYLSILPTGLIWARVDRVSLRKVTKETEAAEVKAVALGVQESVVRE